VENRFEHPPRIRYFIHDLAEDLQAQEHVQNDFGVVGQYLIFLNHLLIQPLVEHSLLGLALDVLDALFQIGVLLNPLQSVMVCHEEIVLVCSAQLTLIFIVEFDLILDFLELPPFVWIDLFKHQLFQLHPSIYAKAVVEDVLVGAHCHEAGAFCHKEAAILIIKARREHLHLVKRHIIQIWLIYWHLFVQAIEAAEDMVFDTRDFLPQH
jgi:hypothetical protein